MGSASRRFARGRQRSGRARRRTWNAAQLRPLNPHRHRARRTPHTHPRAGISVRGRRAVVRNGAVQKRTAATAATPSSLMGDAAPYLHRSAEGRRLHHAVHRLDVECPPQDRRRGCCLPPFLRASRPEGGPVGGAIAD